MTSERDARQRLNDVMTIGTHDAFKLFIQTEPLQLRYVVDGDERTRLTDFGWAILSYLFEMVGLQGSILNNFISDGHMKTFKFAEDVKQSADKDEDSRAWTEDFLRMTVALALIQIRDCDDTTADELLERSGPTSGFDEQGHFRRWYVQRYLPEEALLRAELKSTLDKMVGDEALFRHLECDGYPSWSVFFKRWTTSYMSE